LILKLGKETLQGTVLWLPVVLTTVVAWMWYAPVAASRAGDNMHSCPANMNLEGCLNLFHASKGIAFALAMITFVLLGLAISCLLMERFFFASNDTIGRRWDMSGLWLAIIAGFLGTMLIIMTELS